MNLDAKDKWHNVNTAATSDRTTPYCHRLLRFRSHGLPNLPDLVKQWRWIAFVQAVQLIHKHFGVSRNC
jgi:asparagine synthase (glutamine-hydrolysing)